MPRDNDISWRRHQMETFSALPAICAGTGEFPTQRPVTRSFDIFFDMRLNNRLSKQSWGWWFETPWRSLWRHCYVSLSQWGGNNAWPMLFFLMWHRTSHERTVTYHMGLHEFRDCITNAHMFFFNMKLLTVWKIRIKPVLRRNLAKIPLSAASLFVDKSHFTVSQITALWLLCSVWTVRMIPALNCYWLNVMCKRHSVVFQLKAFPRMEKQSAISPCGLWS